MSDAGWIFGALAVGGLAGAAAATVGMHARTRRTMQALTNDVTRAADSLRAQERSVEEASEVRSLVLASMEEGVLLLDRGGDRVFSNDALVRHLGSLPPDAEHLLPLGLREAVSRVAGEGAPVHVEVETGAPSRWLRASAIPAGDDGSVLLVVRDVTESRRLDTVRRDFVANASHELKTPVASIRATAETLRDGAIDDPAAARRFTEQLEREALRLSRIVTDLLDLSRLEGGSDLEDEVDLGGVAQDEVDRLQQDADRLGVILILETEPSVFVSGSRRDLALMTRNLVDNAIRYTPAAGNVQITVHGEGDRALLRVSDTGMGIPRADVSRVFERFYRVDRARSRGTGGTGLGLAIVKHVAENHGGTVDVQSELGLGTTIEVTFPRDPAGRAS